MLAGRERMGPRKRLVCIRIRSVHALYWARILNRRKLWWSSF